MNKNLLIVSAAFVIIAVAGLLYVKNGQVQNTAVDSQDTNTITESVISENPAQANDTQQKEVKEFLVSGSNFTFDVPSINVAKGDRVKITFKNNEGTHNLLIDGLNLGTETIGAGEEDSIEFTADQEGIFEFYCSVGNHKEQGMMGTLMVN
jgi:plastocyanin